MRIPWSTPTVSDATKLALAYVSDAALTGERLYRLLLQPDVTCDFPSLPDIWTESDSGGNVNVAGGICSMNGNGTFTGNGLVLTAGVARGEMEVSVKHTLPNVASLSAFQLYANNTLNTPANANNYMAFHMGTSTRLDIYVGSLIVRQVTLTVGQTYTMAIRVLASEDGTFLRLQAWISGGTEYATLTKIAEIYRSAAVAATIYPQLSRYANSGANLTEFSEFRVKRLLPTDGPTLTYVADAGAGQVFNGLVFANLAAVGSWATTNVTFAYSYDDGAASYSAEYTLAQLNALTALTTTKRYIRLRITVNSDGTTQQYAGELNADDGTAGTLDGAPSSESSLSESSASESSPSTSSTTTSTSSSTESSLSSPSSESSLSESSASESSASGGGGASESSGSESSASESTASTSSSTSTSTSSTSSSTSRSSSSSSTSAGSSSSSSESGPGDFTVNEYEDFMRDEGDSVTIERKSVTVTTTGARVPAWTTVDTVYASIQPASSEDRAPFERRGIFVTHKVFIAEDPGVTEGDRIGRSSTVKYLIHGVKDVMDRGELYVLYCEEMKVST